MSFQRIRKIRDSRRDPFASDGEPLTVRGEINKFISKELTLDGMQRASPEPRSQHLRRGSYCSRPIVQKEPLAAEFMHINLLGTQQLRMEPFSYESKPKTQRKLSQRAVIAAISIPLHISRQYSLESFRLEYVIGKGGFGKVWKVQLKAGGGFYAMKEMQKVKIVQKRSVNSVMNEKRLLERLQSSFLVNMKCAFQTRQNLYLVLDYCNKGDLRYHLGMKGRFSEDESRFFAACVLVGLEYLHEQNVIHRDLKPENLVIDEHRYLRLTDLGVSKEMRKNNSEDTSGTPGYMAPQVICKLNHSFGVDFFALGVMLFEFMTGRRPYLGANRQQIREKMLAKQVQLDENPPYGWSRESVHLINWLIQRKPEQRIGSKGIGEVIGHFWFKKIDWDLLKARKLLSPFKCKSIDEDYSNYRQSISEDTEIADIQEYKLILRHQDTQSAFNGYTYQPGQISSPIPSRKLPTTDNCNSPTLQRFRSKISSK